MLSRAKFQDIHIREREGEAIEKEGIYRKEEESGSTSCQISLWVLCVYKRRKKTKKTHQAKKTTTAAAALALTVARRRPHRCCCCVTLNKDNESTYKKERVWRRLQ